MGSAAGSYRLSAAPHPSAAEGIPDLQTPVSYTHLKFTLTLTAAGVGGAKLDCLALCEQADAGNFTVTLRGDGSLSLIHI